MKPNFSESIGRLRRGLLPLALWPGLVLAPLAGRGADQLYVNNHTVTEPPQIDAINFLNNGTFDIFTVLPFDTSSTLNFTNNGTMVGMVGFRFDNAAPNNGPRKLANTFINLPGKTIEATDDTFFGLTLGLGGSKLFVAATNIINQGYLTVGANGWLQLVGTNVNLSRSGLQVTPILPGSSSGQGTNFTSDTGIFDNYWAQSNMTVNSSGLLFGFGTNVIAQWPFHLVSRPGGGFGAIPPHTFINPVSDFILFTNDFVRVNVTNDVGEVTNIFVPTNITRQVAFVDVSGTSNMTAEIRWSDSTNPTNDLKTVSVELAVPITNVVTATSLRTTIYFVDRLAGEAARGLQANQSATPITFRPAPYSISRGMPNEFARGFAGNGTLSNTFFLYDFSFTNPVVTAAYAAYSAFVDSLVSEPVLFPGGTVTNLPGRISIYADSLDLSRARLQGLGLIRVQANHLVSSSNAVVDSESLSYDLSSTNGTVRIQNLARESVERLKGDVAAWSGLWTNRQAILIDNYRSNATTGGWVFAPITNNVQVLVHTLMLNAAALITQQPVTVYALNTHSTNTVVNDNMTVVHSLLFDGESLTLNGRLTLSSTAYISTYGDPTPMALDTWVYTNAPHLKYFTNNGTLTIPNEAHFGDDGPAPYAAFVNHGTINAGGQNINSDYCEISGRHSAGASMTVNTRSGKMEGGQISAGADARFLGNVMKFARSTVSAGSRLDLTVTNSLYDEGWSASNAWSCRNGFRLNLKPQTGDLLGTALRTQVPMFARVDHAWAGDDRGPNNAGYSNNVALGQLVLAPEGVDPLFAFSGTGTGNGLYVDYLDLSQLTDYQNQLEIAPNLVIYFAAASLNFTPPLTNGAAQQAEEYLDGQFGGRLRWVRGFAGPNSSVDVVINGQSFTVNRALRNSVIIDSDGDGVPNGFDFFPFDNPIVASLKLANQPPPVMSLSWNATTQKVYQVQSTTNAAAKSWETVLYYTNTATANGPVIINLPVPPGTPRKFYRVGTTLP